VATIALAVSRIFPISLGLMLVVGFGAILMAATGNTTIQLSVPDHLRGRVMSVYTTVFSASVPLGAITFGAIASNFGSSLAIGLGGALTLIVGLGALAWGRRGAFTIPTDVVPAAGATLIPGKATARPR
jgi:predicted MFS family arabinose efflux permease